MRRFLGLALLAGGVCLARPLQSAEESAEQPMEPAALESELPPQAENASEAAGIINGATPEERRRAMLRFCAATRPSAHGALHPKEMTAFCAARLLLNTDTQYALTIYDAALTAVLNKAIEKLKINPADPHALDPFDKHALLNAWLVCPDKFPAFTVRKLQHYMSLYAHRDWRGYGSMNYRLMKDGCGFLAAERWEDMKDADGLDSREIKEATGKRLRLYLSLIVHKNLDEYNAPVYYATDLMVVRMLAEFALDPDMKQRATLTLDWMMANLACCWNQGYYVSTAGRSKYWGSTVCSPDAPGATAAVAWMFFGGNRGIAPLHGEPYHSFWMAYPGSYRLPKIIADIAQDRSAPFANLASVLSASQCDIRQYTWQSPSYGLASQWEMVRSPGNGLFKEARREVLKWISDKPASTFSVQQENPRRPYKLEEHVRNSFGYGENPFHQILQFEGTQIGVYSVPETYEYYKMYVPFTLGGAIVKRIEKEGWVFCHGGSMLFAFKSLKPATWGAQEANCDVLWCDLRYGGWILETSELKPFAGGGVDAELERFSASVLTKAKIDDAHLADALPKFRYISISGHVLEIAFTPFGEPLEGRRKVDGKAVDYRSYPLMGNQWVNQANYSDILVLKHGGESRIYDFRNWEIKSAAE